MTTLFLLAVMACALLLTLIIILVLVVEDGRPEDSDRPAEPTPPNSEQRAEPAPAPLFCGNGGLADLAITHTLGRIRTHPGVGYYCGIATETFGLLTQAYAAIHGEDLDAVIERFLPIAAKDPRELNGEQKQQAFVRAKDEWNPTAEEILEALAAMSLPDRIEALDMIRMRFCQRCGGVALFRHCTCHRKGGH